ncbi:alternate signal-mediated exported protein [Cellulosimicrobium cellulans]|jgi:alternate signal-mediated exported protein|uniref:alternate-type signal peptide domain-containing protein n=1 Tax=Cellulosimicrobium cellulans TaxID=1710 RepID=UPI00195A298F|nr:alternate-type signal peptide domain-containing protein [Cellulosimicrobium cellulans]MBM7818586.1 alternate signal-mediated exported protein [Cellulosimicrobium cellulans]
MTTTTKKNHGAVKGSVAAAAGVAVLLGGAGTFALWNQSGAIGGTGTAVGQLEATFGSATWVDDTPGANKGHTIDAITDFRLVPGDVLTGTVPVSVTAEGENILVDAAVTYGDSFTLPEDVTADVQLLDGTTPVTTITDTGSTPRTLSAVVTITFDETAGGSMTEAVDLSQIDVSLQQKAADNQLP